MNCETLENERTLNVPRGELRRELEEGNVHSLPKPSLITPLSNTVKQSSNLVYGVG